MAICSLFRLAWVALLIAGCAAHQLAGGDSSPAPVGGGVPAPAPVPEPAGELAPSPSATGPGANKEGKRLPPRIKNLFLPYGRGVDWSLAGYADGQTHLPQRRPTFNLQTDFGAVGDGEKDDTKALQNAIAAATEQGGGVIYLPAGTYVIKKPLTIKQSNVVLRGESRNKTKLYFPRSLSDVTGVSWVADGQGRVKSPWAHGGAFITFTGLYPQKSNNERTYLSRVTDTVYSGARKIPTRAGKFTEGQRIRIFLNDRSTPTRRSGAGVAIAAGNPGSTRHGNTTLVLRDTPAWVRHLPAFQSAMAGMASGQEDERGLTVQQAAAADAALGVAPGNRVGAAAAGGTVVAWVYGNNMADSGEAGEIIEHDSISFGARVVKVMRGFILIDRDLPFPVLRKRRWVASIHRDEPSVEGVGLERLTIEFKHTLAGPHFSDRGYNGVDFVHVSSSWVSDVAFVNADNALRLSWVHRSTVREVTVTVTEPRFKAGALGELNGHQGILVNKGSSNLVTGFAIQWRMIHDVAITGACLTVLERGRGLDMNLDHHRNGPWANLFADIDLGLGNRAFASGGQEGRGANTGRATTFWNVRATRPHHPVALPPCTRQYGALVNFVGSFEGNTCRELGWFVAPLGPRAPRNLYRAQLDARRTLGQWA